MIQFNTLKVTQDGKNLIIDAQVENLSYYTNVYIDSIIIDNQRTFLSSGPNNNPVFKYIYNNITANTLGYTTILDNQGNLKGIRMHISYNELGESSDLNTDLLFVYIVIKGSPTINTPCGMDLPYELGIVYNDYPYYLKGMNYIKELNSCCQIPKYFIDYFLRKEAFELSLQVGNYISAITYWNKFFVEDTNIINLQKCNCNG